MIPLSLPSATAFLIVCVSVSPTIRNRYGEIGHPCLTPLSTLKVRLGLPFKLTAAIVFLNNNRTHLMNLSLIFILCIVLNIKFHDTLSYALEKSSFMNTVGCLVVLAQCNVS